MSPPVRVLIYAVGRTGIGQAVRLARLARCLATTTDTPCDVMLACGIRDARELFGSDYFGVEPLTGAYPFTDWWKPSTDPAHPVGERQSAELRDSFDDIVRSFAPDIFISSHFAGLAGEVTLALPYLERSGCKCILALRDIYNTEEFSRYPGLSFSDHVHRYYSDVLVFGVPATLPHLPIAELNAADEDKVSFMGYIPPGSPWVPEYDAASPPGLEVLCQVGGGVDGYQLADSTASACHRLRQAPGTPLRLAIACGPLMPREDSDRLARWKSDSTSISRWWTGSARAQAPGESVLQVSMSGYNSCAEAAWYRRPALLIPRNKPGDKEQELRALLFSQVLAQVEMTSPSPAGSLDDRISHVIDRWAKGAHPLACDQNEILFADAARTRSQILSSV